MRKPKSNQLRLQKRLSEVQEIELLESWIDFGKPDSHTNPLSLPPLPSDAPIGRIDGNTFSRYAGCTKFSQMPFSQKTKDGLRDANFTKMTDIQRASLPHSLCGRDILGAAKTGSGKTLAFIIPVLEKLYRARWGPEDGVGCIIISPTRELAGQIFEVLNSVGKHHSFSAGLIIGGREDLDTEKEFVNTLNILVCTPGRLVQHLHGTPNFDCSQLQVLVLDEADRILDNKFKKELNDIILELPKCKQTFLFSATQTKSVQQLVRLCLKDPEYLSVHEESATATPSTLHQTAMIVPLDQKLDLLWSFIKTHLNLRILVFLSSCKQVKFVFEAFKKLRPGVPLKCLHGRMKQERRMGVYQQFCEGRSVLFSTDVAARGLDFNKVVDWVVQVDCPEDYKTYIHRVGRTARLNFVGRSVLFLEPTEIKMLEKLQERKIPIKVSKANTKRLQPVSPLLAALLVKHTELQYLAQRAFITYLKSIHKQRDKEVFDVTKLSVDDFSASFGLPMTPKIRFLKQKIKGTCEKPNPPPENSVEGNFLKFSRERADIGRSEEDKEKKGSLLSEETSHINEEKTTNVDVVPPTRVLKKKKLKINIHRPVGTRVVFDEEGNSLPPLAKLAEVNSETETMQLDKDKVKRRYAELREALKVQDKEDKLLDRMRLKEKRVKEKMKWKRGSNEEDEQSGDEPTGSDDESNHNRPNKRSKLYFDDSDGDDNETRIQKHNMGISAESISLAEQEELALKLLSSMHS